jgi:hypothetical protein
MEPFRGELEAAHERIAKLEQELREARKQQEPPTPAPAPGAVPAPLAAATDVPWWRWWPALALVGFAVTYGVLFGATLPVGLVDDLTSGTAVFTRGRLLLVVTALALIVGDLALLARSGDRGPLGRLLLVVAAIVAAPVAIPAAIVAFEFGTAIVGIVVCAVLTLGGIWAVLKWIVRGKTE